MKQIEIVVPQERLPEVNAILYKHNVGGMMFYDIKGRLVQKERHRLSQMYIIMERNMFQNLEVEPR